MNDISPPPPPYETSLSPNTTTTTTPTPVFSLTKSMAEVNDLIETLKSSAYGQSFAIDDLKAQLATIQSAMERIEATNQRHVTPCTKDQSHPLASSSSRGGEPIHTPVETDEESYERICKILQGLITDASTAVESDQVPIAEATVVDTEVVEPLILERDQHTTKTFDNASSRPLTSLMSLFSPVSTILRITDMILSTGSLFPRNETDTKELHVIERSVLYLRHQLRRAVYSVEPFVDGILLTPSQELTAFTTRTSDQTQTPPGIRGFLYAIWWSFVFTIATLLWDAEMVRFASGRVEGIVVNGTKDRGSATMT